MIVKDEQSRVFNFINKKEQGKDKYSSCAIQIGRDYKLSISITILEQNILHSVKKNDVE